MSPASPLPTTSPPRTVSPVTEPPIALGDLGSLPEAVLYDYLIAALVGPGQPPTRLVLFIDALRERLAATLPSLDLPWLRSVRHARNSVWHLADIGAINPRLMNWRLAEEQYLDPPPAGWDAGPPYPMRRAVLPTALCGYERYSIEWEERDPWPRGRVLLRAFEPWTVVCAGPWRQPLCARCEQAVRTSILPPFQR